MTRYVAFLRGMNVGGHRLTNAELRDAFADAGFEEVATFRTSGNVILDADDGESRGEIQARIERGLEETLGYAVPTFLRSAAETVAIAVAEPFDPKRIAASDGKLQVLLLAEKPSAGTRKKALALATDTDLLAIDGHELYWLPSGRMTDSELDLDAVGKLVGLGTMRTMGTIELIASKYCAEE